MSSKGSNKLGCLGTVLLGAVLIFAIQYWFVVLFIAVVGIGLWLIFKKGQKVEKAKTAKTGSKQKTNVVNRDALIKKTVVPAQRTSLDFGNIAQVPRTVGALETAKPVIHKLRRKLYDFVVFDIETTGLSPNRSEIIQLSAIKVKKDEVVDRFDSYVHPTESIPTSIVYLTGISDETVKDAPSVKTVINNFKLFFEGLPLVGHNIITFDLPFLIANGFDVSSIDALDTWRLARGKKFPIEMGNLKLPTLKRYFGIQNTSHNSLADCETNVIVYRKLRDDDLQPVTLEKASVSQSLSGLRFSITGEFMGIPREDIADAIRAHGGRVTGSVSKATDYLVDGKQIASTLTDGSHSKKEIDAAKIQAVGGKIKVISLSDLKSMLSGR